MKAAEANLLNFLKKSPRFTISTYEGTYPWIDRECRQLWGNVLRAESNDVISARLGLARQAFEKQVGNGEIEA
jgi:hypothetical protein